ncbi:MAG: glycosyltransferase family 2 protein [Candidatus Aenigmarchaeota archaeon]|nr:glycosyltransferase family 2 protein [Candidatus Aenigmarchaeota archaeon]
MISAVLVVHNEEQRIRPCLESIKRVVDEIIIVHDGACTDKTLSICREYNAKVFVRPYIGEAEPHRCFSFQKSKGDWVLQIDADERLSKEAQHCIKQLVKSSTADAYAFRWEDPEEIRILGIFAIKKYKPCLFRKNRIKFTGLVHEQTGTTGRMVTSEVLLHHKPKPLSNPEVFRKKTRHWAQVAAQTLVKRNMAKKPAFYYLFKAPIWAMIYLFIYLFFKAYILSGKNGWLMAKYHATYNFLLNYNIYRAKLERVNFKKTSSSSKAKP